MGKPLTNVPQTLPRVKFFAGNRKPVHSRLYIARFFVNRTRQLIHPHFRRSFDISLLCLNSICIYKLTFFFVAFLYFNFLYTFQTCNCNFFFFLFWVTRLFVGGNGLHPRSRELYKWLEWISTRDLTLSRSWMLSWRGEEGGGVEGFGPSREPRA